MLLLLMIKYLVRLYITKGFLMIEFSYRGLFLIFSLMTYSLNWTD